MLTGSELKLNSNNMNETLKSLITSLKFKKEHFPEEIIEEQ